VVVHVEHAAAARRTVVRPLRFVHMADQAVLARGVLEAEALHSKEGTHWMGTLPGSVRMVCTIDHSSRMKMRLYTIRKNTVITLLQGCRLTSSNCTMQM
jgi:hypothetical protein